MTTNVTVADVIGSGLFSSKDESFFSWHGCDNVTGDKSHDHLGATVYEVEGFPSLEAARAGEKYEFQVCGECLNNLYYGADRG